MLEKGLVMAGSIDSRSIHIKITSHNGSQYNITNSNDLRDPFVIMNYYTKLLATPEKKSNLSYIIDYNDDLEAYICMRCVNLDDMCITLETYGDVPETAMNSNNIILDYLQHTYNQ